MCCRLWLNIQIESEDYFYWIKLINMAYTEFNLPKMAFKENATSMIKFQSLKIIKKLNSLDKFICFLSSLQDSAVVS